MPAPVIKGIIISVSIITALGIAVLESPHIQAWLEEQRRKLVVLLRSIGEELDPESRRAAEAFAFSGRTPATDAGLRREAYGSIDAAAVATGRSLSGPSRIRHVPARSPSSADDADARQRKGEEYLAQRQQQMMEMRERRRLTQTGSTSAESKPASPTFDELVDGEGNLKQLEPRPIETSDVQVKQEAASRERAGFSLGSHLANPFDDEYALDRCETPRPIPATIVDSRPPASVQTSADIPHPQQNSEPAILSAEDQEHLTFDEQLALALALSESEGHVTSKAVSQLPESEDPEIRAAIAASLEEFEASTNATSPAMPTAPTPHLLDSPAFMEAHRQLHHRIQEWESMLTHPLSPDFLSPPDTIVRAPSVRSEGTDDLYYATPPLSRAQLHGWTAPAPFEQHPGGPHVDMNDSAILLSQVSDAQDRPTPSDAQAISSAAADRGNVSQPHATIAQANDANLGDLIQLQHTTRATRSPGSSMTLAASETADGSFASISRPQSVTDSHTLSSGMEVLSQAEESDHGVMSDDDGVLTPDTWSEIESREGDEDEVEHEQGEIQGSAH